jgi:general secretion pathway protein D
MMYSIPRRLREGCGAARHGWSLSALRGPAATRHRRAGWAGWTALVLLVALPPAGAAPAVSPDTPLELTLRETSLGIAINTLAAQTRAQVLFVDQEGKLLNRKVSLNLVAKNTEDAVKKLCLAAQCYYRKDEDGVFYISAEPFAAPAPAVDPKTTAAEPAPMAELVPRNEIFEKVFLQFTHPEAMYQLLAGNSFAVNKKPRPGSSTDELKELDIIPGVVDPASGKYTPPPAFVNPFGSPASLTGAGQFGGFGGGGLGGGGFGGGGLGGGGFGGGGLGGGLGGGGLGGGFGGGLGGAGGGLGGAGGGAGGLLPQGITGVLAYPLDNSLLVRGDADAIADLKQIIRLLDIPPKQIQIKVEQIRIETSAQKALGIDWDIVTNDFAASSALGQSTGGSINIAYASGNFRVRLAALLTQGKATIVDSATVSTVNNVPAIIQTLSVSFVFLPQRQQIQGAGLVTVFVPQPIAIPTQLVATPRVNGDGSITMYIPFTISRPSGESVSPDGQRIPNQISTQLFVLRRVPSGGTVVLGAISNKDDSQSENRIPLLSELPIIGNLFRSRLNRKNDQETLFFFTPTVLPDLPGSSEVAP